MQLQFSWNYVEVRVNDLCVVESRNGTSQCQLTGSERSTVAIEEGFILKNASQLQYLMLREAKGRRCCLGDRI